MMRRPIMRGVLLAIVLCASPLACTKADVTPDTKSDVTKSDVTAPEAKADALPPTPVGGPPVPPEAEDATQSPELQAAGTRCRDKLQAQLPKASIEVNVQDGPDGTQIVRARDPKAYPGTGVCALIYDAKTKMTYGQHGEQNLAALVRQRGWLENRLPDEQLIKLVHEAQFSGLLIVEAPTVEAGANGGLRVNLPAHTMRGNLDRTWVIDIPKTGDVVVKAVKP